MYSSMQPPKQLPLVMEQFSTLRQRPHVSLQFEPYHPTSQAIMKNNFLFTFNVMMLILCSSEILIFKPRCPFDVFFSISFFLTFITIFLFPSRSTIYAFSICLVTSVIIFTVSTAYKLATTSECSIPTG